MNIHNKYKTLHKHRFRNSKTVRLYNKTKNNKIKGGGYNNTFLDKFEENLKKTKDAISKFSGKNKLVNTEKFIDNQLTKARKQAARDLVENTIYITLDEISELVEKTIKKAYSQIDTTRDIYLYVGKKEKSFYFLSILALYYIRKHGLKEPIKFINSITLELFDEIGESALIILDDVSYSGSQLSTMMNNIYYDRVVNSNKPPPNIFILLMALCTFSKNKLSRVPVKKTRTGIVLSWAVSPFKLIYSEERLYEPLIIKLGIQRYFNIQLFFSPYTMSTPYISLYLDYKIADEASTYKTTLLYGPIIPLDYDYKGFIIDVHDYQYEFFPNEKLFDEGQYQRLFIDFNKESKTDFNTYNYKLTEKLLEKLIEDDTTVKFYPLISTCNEDQNILDIISEPDIHELDYRLFITPKGCVEGNSDCSTTDSVSLSYVKSIITEKSLDNKKIIDLCDKINSQNCPITWYKLH